MVVLVVDSVTSKASADFYKPCFIPKYIIYRNLAKVEPNFAD